MGPIPIEVSILILLFILQTFAYPNVTVRDNTNGKIYTPDEILASLSKNVYFSNLTINDASPTLVIWHPWGVRDADIITVLVHSALSFVSCHQASLNIVSVGWGGSLTPICRMPNATSCPDILIQGDSQIQDRYEHGALHPLNQFITQDAYFSGHRITDDILPSYFYSYFIDGDWYGLPFTTDVRIVFYNKTTFSRLNIEPPPTVPSPDVWTWEAFAKMVVEIYEKSGDYGWTWGTGYDEDSKILLLMTQEATLPFVTQEMQCNLNQSKFYDIIEQVINPIFRSKAIDPSWMLTNNSLFKNWLNSSIDDPTPLPAGISIDSYPRFNGFVIDSPALLSHVNQTIGVAVIPGRTTLLGGSGISLTSGSKNLELSWKYVTSLTDPDSSYLIEAAIATYSLPPFKALWSNERFNSSIWDVLRNQTTIAVPSQYPLLTFKGLGEIETRKPFRYLLANLVFKNISVVDAVNELCRNIDLIFEPLCNDSNYVPHLTPCNPTTLTQIRYFTINTKKCNEGAGMPNSSIPCSHIPTKSTFSYVMTAMCSLIWLGGFILIILCCWFRDLCLLSSLSQLILTILYIIGTSMQAVGIFFSLGEIGTLTCIAWAWIFFTGFILSLCSLYLRMVIMRTVKGNWVNRGGFLLVLIAALGITWGLLSLWSFWRDDQGIEKNQYGQNVCSEGDARITLVFDIMIACFVLYTIGIIINTSATGSYILHIITLLLFLITYMPYIFLLYFTTFVVENWILFLIIHRVISILITLWYLFAEWVVRMRLILYSKGDTDALGLPRGILSLIPNTTEKRKTDDHLLPKATTTYFKKAIKEHSFMWMELESYLKKLNGLGLPITEAWIVYSPNLVDAFSLYKSNWVDRHQTKKRYKSDVRWVMEKYTEKIMKWDWNRNSQVAILPMAHGTGRGIAWKIFKNGFTSDFSVSSDTGWYGKGIYTTSDCTYAMKYCSQHKTPAIIIANIMPGNVYPVTDKLYDGKALENNYQSHYVVTNRDGLACSSDFQDVVDELVVVQEAQALPYYLLVLDKSRCYFDADSASELANDQSLIIKRRKKCISLKITI